MPSKPPLILASASPRRRELLAGLGVEFTSKAADVDEARLTLEAAEVYVLRMAREKAAVVANQFPNAAVLAADTIVCQGERVYGKPTDREAAFSMWRKLSNATHTVLTGVTLVYEAHRIESLASTEVGFGDLDESSMQRYWASGEPHDKAGAYAIQGQASAWVKFIRGSYSNVVGLPLYEVNKMLKQTGHNWL